MSSSRRNALQLLTAAAAASALPVTAQQRSAPRSRFRAVAFDAFPVFDPRPVAALAESVFPGQGAALMNAWRARQFEYQWLRALAGQYVDFLQATRDALHFAAGQLQLTLSAAQETTLMGAWTNLQVWPDAIESVRRLRAAGLRLAFLSNMTQPMLDAGLRNAGIADQFEAVISTDRIRSYKPERRAYQLGVDTLQLPKEQILFVAFAGWDMAGAKWFGYPTFWANRGGAPLEKLDAEPDAMGSDLAALERFALTG